MMQFALPCNILDYKRLAGVSGLPESSLREPNYPFCDVCYLHLTVKVYPKHRPQAKRNHPLSPRRKSTRITVCETFLRELDSRCPRRRFYAWVSLPRVRVVQFALEPALNYSNPQLHDDHDFVR